MNKYGLRLFFAFFLSLISIVLWYIVLITGNTKAAIGVAIGSIGCVVMFISAREKEYISIPTSGQTVDEHLKSRRR